MNRSSRVLVLAWVTVVLELAAWVGAPAGVVDHPFLQDAALSDEVKVATLDKAREYPGFLPTTTSCVTSQTTVTTLPLLSGLCGRVVGWPETLFSRTTGSVRS